MSQIGHNNGPAMDAGVSYRKHVWTKARRDLLPVLPLPVVKRRVKRAAEIGLDYKTYATVRATTGRDVVALLFSTNALRLFRAGQAMEPTRGDKLRQISRIDRRAMTIAPLRPKDVPVDHLDAIFAAPHIHVSFTEASKAITLAKGNHPGSGVLLIGDTTTERDWSLAGRLAGYLSSQQFFT